VFPSRKPIVHLHINGQVLCATTDQPFYVAGQGWTEAADLRVGDRLVGVGKDLPIERITTEERPVVEMQPGVQPFPPSSPLPAGTMIQTRNGLKPIEDVKPGDYFVVAKPFDPERN
jgi:hypothetical protein